MLGGTFATPQWFGKDSAALWVWTAGSYRSWYALLMQIGFVGTALALHKNRRLIRGYPLEKSGAVLQLDAGDVPRNVQVRTCICQDNG